MIIDGFNLLSGFKGNGMVYIIIECLNSSSSTLSYEINKFMSINGQIGTIIPHGNIIFLR